MKSKGAWIIIRQTHWERIKEMRSNQECIIAVACKDFG
jgi:hypothetical protein